MEASSLTGLKRGEGQFLYGAIVYLAMWKWINNDSIAAQFTLNYNVCNLDKATQSSVVVIGRQGFISISKHRKSG